MTSNRPAEPSRLPTLTEVVELPALPQDHAAPPRTQPAPQEAQIEDDDVVRLVDPQAAGAPQLSEDQLTQRVLTALQLQVDLMLEQRVRESVTPALARLTDALVREMRDALALSLRDVVAKAVTQELSRHRTR